VGTKGRRLALAIVAAGAGPAGADDEVAALPEVPEVRDRTGIAEASGWLQLAPIVRPASEGFGGTEDSEEVDLRLGATTRLLARAGWWQNEGKELPAVDLPALGWSAGLQLQHDFGWARLVATGGVSFVDSRLARGHYVDVGIQLRRDFRLSRWMRAWIALGASHRYWLDEPPLGELDASQLLLTIGTTFR
jgi:hypothetical protein